MSLFSGLFKSRDKPTNSTVALPVIYQIEYDYGAYTKIPLSDKNSEGGIFRESY